MKKKNAVLLICEKRVLAQKMASILQKRHPNSDIYVVLAYSISYHQHNYNIAQPKFVPDSVQYKLRQPFELDIYKMTDAQEMVCATGLLVTEVTTYYDFVQIINAFDPNDRGAHKFDLLADTLGLKQTAAWSEAIIIRALAWDDTSLNASIDQATSLLSNSLYLEAVKREQIREYFTYAFNYLSIRQLQPYYENEGIENPPVLNPETMLSFWLILQNHADGFSEQQLFNLYWNAQYGGTGKYTPVPFSRIINYPQILDRLINLNWIANDKTKSGYYMTQKGMEAAKWIHPNCFDPDQPHRVEQWIQLPFEQAKSKIQVYLKAYWAKQQRLIQQRLTRDPRTY